MNPRFRTIVLFVCLLGLAIPAGALAGAGDVAPPGSGDRGTVSAATRAAADPGCRAKNVIDFRGEITFRVRHRGLIRCSDVHVRIGCQATLFHEQEEISRIRDRDEDRCRIGTSFSQSERYPAGDEFTQEYRYKLTLLNRRQKWSGTTRKCPRRSNGRRTLTCTGSIEAIAPDRSVDTIRS